MDKKIRNAFLKAYSADPVSAFGGVVAINRLVNEKLANLITLRFFEIIIAPKFSNKAKIILTNLCFL